eukprot:gene27856-12033_t
MRKVVNEEKEPQRLASRASGSFHTHNLNNAADLEVVRAAEVVMDVEQKCQWRRRQKKWFWTLNKVGSRMVGDKLMYEEVSNEEKKKKRLARASGSFHTHNLIHAADLEVVRVAEVVMDVEQYEEVWNYEEERLAQESDTFQDTQDLDTATDVEVVKAFEVIMDIEQNVSERLEGRLSHESNRATRMHKQLIAKEKELKETLKHMFELDVADDEQQLEVEAKTNMLIAVEEQAAALKYLDKVKEVMGLQLLLDREVRQRDSLKAECEVAVKTAAKWQAEVADVKSHLGRTACESLKAECEVAVKAAAKWQAECEVSSGKGCQVSGISADVKSTW